MKPSATEVSLLPYEMGYLPESIKTIALEELGETDEVRKEAITEMRKLVKAEEAKLYCPETDLYLLSFLRARKFNVKRAFGVFQNYYYIKKHHPDVYGKPDFEVFVKNITDRIINVLPYRDEEGSVIFIVQLRNWNTEDMKFHKFVHAITVAMLLCVEDPATQVCGVKIIVDVKGLGLHHIKHIHPKYLHLIGRGLRNCLPVRFKAIHVFNESVVFQYFWNIVRLALSEKIKNRVHFHASSKESLCKYFPLSILPKEYGGQMNYDNSFWVKKVESAEDLYDERMRWGYRSRKASNDDTL